MRYQLAYIYSPAGSVEVTSPECFCTNLNGEMSAMTWWEASGCLHSQARAAQVPYWQGLVASASLLQRPPLSQQAGSPRSFPPEISQSLSHPIRRIQGKNQLIISCFLFEENNEQQVCQQGPNTLRTTVGPT